MRYADRWKTVRVEVDDGIAWVELNRPEKRNAMSPTLNARDDRGARGARRRRRRAACSCSPARASRSRPGWTSRSTSARSTARPSTCSARCAATRRSGSGGMLRTYAKPTIAMVNGWCFGGAFTPLVALRPRDRRRRGDLRAVGDQLGHPARQRRQPRARRDGRLARRAALHHDRAHLRRAQAAEMGLVNWSVPRARAAREVEALARELLDEEPGRRCAPRSSASSTAGR